MKRSQVTIKDIAEIAGVSFSTVSRCLNDSSVVSPETKKKVCDIADKMGFEFNSSARGLITSTVGTVGIILPEQFTEISVNVYHGMLMNSLRTSLEKADVDLIVTYQKNHFTGKNNIMRLVTRRKIDGLIMLVENIEQETLDFLEARSVPFVCTHYPPADNIKNQDVIYTDHYAGGKLVAEHLMGKGRSRFMILAVEDVHLEFQLREKGFTKVVKEAGFEVARFETKSVFNAAYETTKSMIDEVRKYDAVFALNDLMALGTIKALLEAGIRVPEDVAVVGYDDSEFSRYSVPMLTSVHQPKEELAMFACQRLFHQMEKKKEKQEFLKKLMSIQPVLIERDST